MGLADRLSSGGMFSADDSQRVSDMKNHPEYEPGFDGGGSNMFDDSDFGGGGGFDDLFGDSGDSGGSSGSGGFDDLFGSSSSGGSDPFGSSSSGSSDPFGSGSSGGSDPFGNNSFGNNSFGNSSFGPTSPFQQGNAQQSQGSEALDKLVDAGADAAKNVGAILMELVKSIKLRNADDIGYYSRNLIICGIVFIPLGIILGLVGMVFNSASLGFSGLGTEVILSGALLLGSGTTGMGSAAFVLSKTGVREEGGIENLPDINESNNFTDDYEDSIEMYITICEIDHQSRFNA